MAAHEVGMPGESVLEELPRPVQLSETEMGVREREEDPIAGVPRGSLEGPEVSNFLLEGFGHRGFLRYFRVIRGRVGEDRRPWKPVSTRLRPIDPTPAPFDDRGLTLADSVERASGRG